MMSRSQRRHDGSSAPSWRCHERQDHKKRCLLETKRTDGHLDKFQQPLPHHVGMEVSTSTSSPAARCSCGYEPTPQETVWCCSPSAHKPLPWAGSDGHAADGAVTVQRWAAAALERLVMVVVAGMLMLLMLRPILPLLRRPCWHCTWARHCLRGALRSRLVLTLSDKWIACWRRRSLHGHQIYTTSFLSFLAAEATALVRQKLPGTVSSSGTGG